MQLLVGLGNPGDQYRHNRHNVGFMAVDAIVERHRLPAYRKKFGGLLTEGTIAGERVLVLKPETFMNRSGDSVAQAVGFYKLAATDVTVFYDELDLVPGKIRVKRGGGNGGHNGLRSIDPQIGLEYRRVRIGIGHPGKEFVTPHVLGDFAKADREWLEPLLDGIASNVDLLLKGDDNGFMNKLAVQNASEPAKPAAPKGQSHIRAARQHSQPVKPAPTGAMAAMLKKLLGDNGPT